MTALEAAVREKQRKRESPLPSAAKPRIVELPRSRLPSWNSVTSELAPAVSGAKLSPVDVFEAVKGSIWVTVAGHDTKDFEELEELSQGSAVAVSLKHLITNCHVVEDRPFIVIGQGEKVRRASLVSAHWQSDRCILEVNAPSLSPVRGIRPNSDLMVGERVYTVGSPSGLERTIGEGIISGLRPSQRGRFIQTTAPMSAGSSGGGLFDSSGNLIGVTTFLLKEAQAINFLLIPESHPAMRRR